MILCVNLVWLFSVRKEVQVETIFKTVIGINCCRLIIVDMTVLIYLSRAIN